MGGYAAAAVNGVASAATGIGVGVSEWFKRRPSGHERSEQSKQRALPGRSEDPE
jgi:hypothetical protein